MSRLIEDKSEEYRERFPNGECYRYFENDKQIGLAVINNDEDDKVFIYIKKELRGNGYGKALFSEVINELLKKEYKDIKVKFSKDNIQMLRIVNNYGALHLSTNGGIVRYLIPINNDMKSI